MRMLTGGPPRWPLVTLTARSPLEISLSVTAQLQICVCDHSPLTNVSSCDEKLGRYPGTDLMCVCNDALCVCV